MAILQPSEGLMKRVVLIMVFIALFLDNMLLTTVVPIIPNFLIRKEVEVKLKSHNLSSDLKHEFECLTYGYNKNIFSLKGHIPSVNQNLSHCFSSNRTRLEPEVRKTLQDDNLKVGMMFGSKAVMQIITNPFVGPLTNRIGYSVPMFTGFVIMFVSTLVFAFGQSYTVLFVARAIQGIGSAFTSVSGMGMLATYYTEEKERSKAFSIALSGLAFGVLIGPPFGGLLFDSSGKTVPFVILAVLALLDGILQILVFKPNIRPEVEKGSSVITLLKDPYILIAAGSITFGNMGIAMLEPSLPLWMKEKMNSESWEQGIAFLPCSISYLIGTNLFGYLSLKWGQWLTAMVGMFIESICLFIIPFTKSIYQLILPNFGLGLAIGMVDSSMMPLMGNLVDLRHVGVYGSIYAIADMAFCLSFAIGPLVSGSFVAYIGFENMIKISATITMLYAPLNVLLRDPKAKNDNIQGNDKMNLSDHENMDFRDIPSANSLCNMKEYSYGT